MEAMGAEGQWTSLSGVYTAEEADFMALLLNNQLPSFGATLQNFWPPHDQSSSTIMNNDNHCSLELSNHNYSNLCTNNFSSRGTTTSASSSAFSSHCANSIINVFPTSSNENIINSQPTTLSFDFFLAGDHHLKAASHNSYLSHGDHQRRNDNDRLSSEEKGSGSEAFAASPPDQKIKVCSDHQASALMEDNKRRSPSYESSAKRPRSLEKVDQVDKKYVKSKKMKQKLVSTTSKRNSVINNEEEGGYNNNNGNFGGNGHCSSSATCCSGDESINGSGQETSTGGDTSSLSPKEPNSDAKARAQRGSATDPQSLYARKRRERINERLKILQTLVPNGTKVDISTMLEEAVQYVKFLQLQIKLLSSDELWMYAPITYNGKEIGLDHLNLSLAK